MARAARRRSSITCRDDFAELGDFDLLEDFDLGVTTVPSGDDNGESAVPSLTLARLLLRRGGGPGGGGGGDEGKSIENFRMCSKQGSTRLLCCRTVIDCK